MWVYRPRAAARTGVYTCLPPAIIVSLQGPIIEKPRLLSTPIARGETIFLLGAHEPRCYVELPAIIVTYHRNGASVVIQRTQRDEKGRTILDLRVRSRSFARSTPRGFNVRDRPIREVKWRTIINDSRRDSPFKGMLDTDMM